MEPAIRHRYIVRDERILGGEPIIEGTRTPVRAVAELWRQLAFATAEERVLLTHNRVHFERLVEEHFHAGNDHPGVFFAARRLPGELVRRLLS